MKSLVHEAAKNVTEAEVISNAAYPLVRELAHTYELQVIHKAEEGSERRHRLYLAREDGLCVGYARYDENDGFVFRNVMVRKERGSRSNESYYSYFSAKLPYLMRLIKKEKLIPSSSDELLNKDEVMLTGIPDAYAQQFGDTRKGGAFGGDEQHLLLEIAFGNRSAVSCSQESIEGFKNVLDKYRELDTIVEKRQEYMRETLNKELWVVGTDLTQTFMVGRVKVDYEMDESSYRPARFKNLCITQKFKRVSDLHEVPEVMPKLTMLKIHAEQNYKDMKFIGMLPAMHGAVPELDVVAFRTADGWGSDMPLKPNWVVFPCDS